jgi:hypothetical protein
MKQSEIITYIKDQKEKGYEAETILKGLEVKLELEQDTNSPLCNHSRKDRYKLKEEVKQDIETKLSELYTEFENNKPPMTLSRYEAEYNEGFFRGRLNAIEVIVVKLTGKNGDDLLNKLK